MKKIIISLVFMVASIHCFAQPISGTTGLLNIPSAEMQRDGTFMFGANYLPEAITHNTWDYNTANYYLNITFFPFWEVNYRMTIFDMGNGSFNQDRTFAVRGRLLKESKFLPAVVVGGTDIFTSSGGTGNQYFGGFYFVADKSLYFQKTKLTTTIGYGLNIFRNNQYQGLFGGLALSPGIFKPITFMVEYDTKAINAGASVLLFNHLQVYAFAYDLKYFCGGIFYKIYLKN